MDDSFILFEDQNWLVVNKPTALPTVASHGGELGAVEWLELHHNLRLYGCHPLPRGTSGVVVLAKNVRAQQEYFHCQTEIRSEYTFWSMHAASQPNRPSTWDYSGPVQSNVATTHFTSVRTVNGYYQYKAHVTDERPGQIYAHASACGVPIAGSIDCGKTKLPRPMLHRSGMTSRLWPTRLAAPLPPSFLTLEHDAENDIALAICQDRRLGWLKSITNAYRIIHRDEIDSQAFAAEVYADHMAVWAYDESKSPTQTVAELRPTIEKLLATYQCNSALLRTSNRDPHHNKLTRASYWIGPPQSEPMWVYEHGLHYQIQLADNKHTGLFLDQRDNRRRVALQAARKRIANLFAFTCSFSQVAIANQAEVVFSIDLAKGCLDTGIKNLATNQLDHLRVGKFIQEDARKWLARQLRRKSKNPSDYKAFDLIICDPPVYAASQRGGSFSVAQAWEELVAQSASILCHKGIALFANNHRDGDEYHYQSILKKHFKSVIKLDPPFDFPATQNTYVRTYWCELADRKA